MKINNSYKSFCLYTFTFVALASIIACSPISKATKVKRTPKEYIGNYYGEGICGEGDEYNRKNRKAWVVYSDRANNPVFLNRGGKIETNKAEFVEPFIVIKHKGDYVRLMEFDAKVANERKIKQPKNAKYVGWMPKSNLLLRQHSFTNMNSGLKNKYVVSFKDTMATYMPKQYLAFPDSAMVFADPNLTIPKGKVSLYEIVYRLKKSSDDRKSLISRSDILSADSFSEDVLGWIDNSLLVNIGQQLHINLDSRSLIQNESGDTLTSYISDNESCHRMTNAHKALMYAPVYEFQEDTSYIVANTSVLRPLIDNLDTYVYNTKGDKIFYQNGVRISNNLRKINVIYVIEGGIYHAKGLESIANAIQTNETIFGATGDDFSYKFGIVLPFENNASLGLVDRYNMLVSFLAQNVDSYAAHRSSMNDWSGLRKAITMLRGHENETNLIIVVGETAVGGEKVSSILDDQLVSNNCRILGFQLFSDKTDAGNNFVLQTQDMIASYAKRYIQKKQDIIVFPDKVKSENHFKTISRNAYLLNFPDSSMTQGGIVFPEKTEILNMKKFRMYVDTLVAGVKKDNMGLINDLYHAFHKLDNVGNKYDSVMRQKFGLTFDSSPSYGFTSKFDKDFPVWYSPVVSVVQEKMNNDDSFRLLLSEEELIKLQKFIGGLSKYEIDYVAQQTLAGRAPQFYDYKNEFDVKQETYISEDGIYVSTRNMRRKLRRYLINTMNEDKLYKREKSSLNQYSVAEALMDITTCPWRNSYVRFDSIPVGKLIKKRVVSDQELFEIIQYLRKTNEVFNQNISSFPKFESNGKVYYWINQKYLP